MSFWDLSDGGAANENVDTNYKETGFKMIPDKSNVLATVSDAKWDTAYQSTEKYIQIVWEVEKPSEFSGVKVLQKLWVTDFDPNAKTKEDAIKKRDTARTKLARIDAFGKSRLMNSGKSEFTDDDLALALVGVRGVVFVMQGETNGNPWNRVVQINPLDTDVKIGDSPIKQGGGASSGGSGGGRPSSGGGGFNLDDEIPFLMEWRV